MIVKLFLCVWEQLFEIAVMMKGFYQANIIGFLVDTYMQELLYMKITEASYAFLLFHNTYTIIIVKARRNNDGFWKTGKTDSQR